MSANGTPQGYLANFRQNTTASNYRDPSMEQNNTNSGNPQGYYDPGSQAPPNRYIPPSFNPVTGRWDEQGQTYSLPSAYTPNGGGGLPSGPTPMPSFYGAPQGQAQAQQWSPQQAAPGGPPMPNFAPAPPGQGTPQPATGGLSPAQQNAVNGNGMFPAFQQQQQQAAQAAYQPSNPGSGFSAMNAAFTGGRSPNSAPAPPSPGTAQPAPQGLPLNDYHPHMQGQSRHAIHMGYNLPSRYSPNIRNY